MGAFKYACVFLIGACRCVGILVCAEYVCEFERKCVCVCVCLCVAVFACVGAC